MGAPGYENAQADYWFAAYEGQVPSRNLTWRDVPERPLLQGQWWSQTWWLGQMPSSAFLSADRAGVFDTSKRGPRGGLRFAVLDMDLWTRWRAGYQYRAQLYEQGRAKMTALRRMGAAPKR